MREPNAVDKYLRVNPHTKMFEPVWLYRDILPYALGPDQNKVNANATIAITSTDPVTIPFKLPHSSLSMDNALGNPLQIDQITFDDNDATAAAAAVTVFIADQGEQRQYMNFPCHIRTIAASGQLSARLSEDLFLPTRHQLLVTFQKTTGATNQHLFFKFHGKIYYTWSSNLQSHPADRAEMVGLVNKWLERRKYVNPYWMTTNNGAVVIPANQTVEVHAQVGDEGHFEATHLLRAFTSGVATTSPFEVSILNQQTRQALMNGAIHSYMIGDAFNPQPFPCSFIVPAGQILRFKIKDLSGSSNTVYLTLRGRKWRCPITDIETIKRQYGVGIVDGLPSAFKQPSRQAEMAGVNE